jgi:hydroxymethylpyrimidine/phosphomethylpyrimidine kinase
MLPVALSIAGVDPSGGAGIAADLKTFHQHGVYGCAVVTLLTAQNTSELRRSEAMPAEFVAEQLDCLLDDIRPAAVKTGALGTTAIVEVVAERMRAAGVALVVDPVRIAKHGAALLDVAARTALLEKLLPLATLVTVNADEAAWLAERDVRDHEQALLAAERLHALGVRSVLVKGGHLPGERAIDLLLLEGTLHRLEAPRLNARHTHGVGCTLSAAIAANLAHGLPLLAACERAKRWLSRAIAGAQGVGHGIGGVDHWAPLPE